MTHDYFGPDVAERYDADSADRFASDDLDPTLDRLQELAGDGRALELAIGTGRVGLALAARGVPVSGIELSEAMVAQLRAKPGGDALGVTIGDMATTRVDGTFRVVYLVFNTIVNLTSQDAQVACVANAAAHLEPGGHFVVEVRVPQLRRLPPGERLNANSGHEGHYCVDEFDVVDQRQVSHHFTDEGDGTWRHRPIPFRYVWPSELDLMARMAGMRLRHRWADWNRGAFTADSPIHVSIWEKA